MIVIVDYGMGNLGSIQNMLKKAGFPSLITSDKSIIENADKLILPGVGAFDNAINNLNSLDLIDLLNKKALEEKIPVLGICLGMQLLSKSSEEGILSGLGWIDAVTIKFKFDDSNLKIPHMGWNNIKIMQNSTLFDSLDEEQRFYFVHSYHVKCSNPENVLISCQYGIDFTAGVINGNIMGVQFHPEKSHKYGLNLLKNFAEKS